MSLRSTALSFLGVLRRVFALRRLMRIVAGLILLLGLLRVVHVWRRPKPVPPTAAALEHARHVTITRDRYGVPHIVGDSDADAAFGLAYAHAEDDFPTIQDSLVAARGQLGRLLLSKDALINDYYVSLVRVHEQVEAGYESLEPTTQAVLQGYADGLNYYAAKHPTEGDTRFLPYEGRDVARGFAHKLPFMVGVVSALQKLMGGQVRAVGDVTDVLAAIAPPSSRQAPATALGSNGHAVHRSRSSDDVTRLNVNSHQPWEGPVTWYEAHIKSGQGWNTIGGVFPGSPLILHGHNEKLGWAHTVNAPDLVDVYRLTMHPEKPLHYRYGDSWQPLTVKTNGSMIRSVIGKSISTMRGINDSIAMLTRSSDATGMPLLPIVNAMSLVLYCLATNGTFSRRSGSAEVELMIGWALVMRFKPASMPARFVVSKLSGTSTTACTVSIIHGKTSSPSDLRGPRLMSSACAPASTCFTARSWKNFASRAFSASFTFSEMM